VTESLLADTTAVGERKVKEIKQNTTYKIQNTKQNKERGKKTLPLLAWLLSIEDRKRDDYHSDKITSGHKHGCRVPLLRKKRTIIKK